MREADLIKYSKGKANNRHFFLFNGTILMWLLIVVTVRSFISVDCVVYTILATSLLKKSSTKYVFKGNWEHNQSIVEDITDTRGMTLHFYLLTFKI